MSRKITKKYSSRKKSLLVFVIALFLCIVTLAEANAYSVTVTNSDADVLYPSDGATFWVQDQNDRFNLTASGDGHIYYTVITDNNPLLVYEKSWMYLDSYY